MNNEICEKCLDELRRDGARGERTKNCAVLKFCNHEGGLIALEYLDGAFIRGRFVSMTKAQAAEVENMLMLAVSAPETIN